MRTRLKSLMHRTTTRFVAFYLLLILLPTVLFITAYSGNLRRQALREQTYEQRTILQQNVQSISEHLTQVEAIVSSLQASRDVLTLLEGRYASASEELFAYTSYIHPLLESVQMLHPVVTDVYLYRARPSFLGNSGMVHNLCDWDDLDASQRPDKEQESMGFLALSGDAYRHRDDSNVLHGPRYIYRANLYSQDYSQVVAVAELQLDIEQMMFPALHLAAGDQMYLGWNSAYYPLIAAGDGYRIDTEAPLASAPAATAEETLACAETQGMSFVWIQARKNAYTVEGTTSMVLALLLLIPMLVFSWYVYSFSMRITRFRTHIRKTERGMPVPYDGKISNDEFGDLVREYNALTRLVLEQMDSVREAERVKNAANYYAMSSQVNPHFMFNTLENIRMHIEVERYDEANQMLCTLGRFLRYNISMREESTLRRELEHIEHYLCIYQYRMNNVITYDIDMAEDVPDVSCPFSILQPVVENCLKHGIKGPAQPLHITITLRRSEDGAISVAIADDGVGMDADAIDKLNERLRTGSAPMEETGHVGLGNVNARLSYYYGAGYGVTLAANPAGGLICRMRLGETPQRKKAK